MNRNYIIRQERDEDFLIVEKLTKRAFFNVYRPGCSEHYVLHKFRSNPDFIKELSLLLELDGKIISHVMYARASIKNSQGKTVPIATFGPFSVMPEFQKQGYGEALLRHSFTLARAASIPAIAIEGDYDYYNKYGLKKGKDVGIIYEDDPTADYFLIKELEDGFIARNTGSYTDPRGYFVDEAAALSYGEYLDSLTRHLGHDE